MNKLRLALAVAAALPFSAALAEHQHGTLAVANQGAPTVVITATADSMTGWNVHVETKNFRFAPEHVGQAHVAGEGHAHLYLDGKKIARLYGPWFHVPAQAAGKHSLRVTLNANSHEELAVDGKVIEATTQIGP